MLFNDKLPTDLHIAFELIKVLIMKDNLNLIHKKNMCEHLHNLSRKRKLDKIIQCRTFNLSGTSQLKDEYVG